MSKLQNNLLIILILSLITGFLYYYFLRTNTIGFEYLGIEQIGIFNLKLNSYFLWFPTFIHPFIFSLFTWWAMGFRYSNVSIFFWLIVNLLAEIGQGIEQDFYDNFPIILKHYFKYGVFDWLDVLSIFCGAIFAYIFILNFKKGLV